MDFGSFSSVFAFLVLFLFVVVAHDDDVAGAALSIVVGSLLQS